MQFHIKFLLVKCRVYNSSEFDEIEYLIIELFFFSKKMETQALIPHYIKNNWDRKHRLLFHVTDCSKFLYGKNNYVIEPHTPIIHLFLKKKKLISQYVRRLKVK
jgi:hypothetical protein